MMTFVNLEIFENENNNICIKQPYNNMGYDDSMFVEITPSMVDLVCGELLRLKKEIESRGSEQ